MRRHFGVIDTEAGDANGFIDSEEWLKYFQQRSKLGKRHHHRTRQSHLEKLRLVVYFAAAAALDKEYLTLVCGLVLLAFLAKFYTIFRLESETEVGMSIMTTPR